MLNPEGDFDRESAKILYVPDFLATRGGIIHISGEILGLDAAETEQLLQAAIACTGSLLRESQTPGRSPWDVAVAFATARMDGARATTGATA